MASKEAIDYCKSIGDKAGRYYACGNLEEVECSNQIMAAFDADPYLLGKGQTIKGNSKITKFSDGWKLHEWVDEPEKYHHKEKTDG